MVLSAHVGVAPDGKIVVVQFREIRCNAHIGDYFCDQMLMNAVNCSRVKKDEKWDIELKCRRCKTKHYFKLR